MPGLVPGIHVLTFGDEDVDGRVKPGHDKFWSWVARKRTAVAALRAGWYQRAHHDRQTEKAAKA
jgi:hypothetical protein